ncbi:hypothetical protein F4815DRAFT_70066 [Daldinia loculata]|nr:hypothetical protein F4815DRAFT_70066 [Daldinia loculata]
MSHLSLQCSESPLDSHHLEDSPTIGRAVVNYPLVGANPPLSLSIPPPSEKQRKTPAPSPLQTSTAVSPPSSASPSRSKFPEPIHELFPGVSVAQILSREPPQYPLPTRIDRSGRHLSPILRMIFQVFPTQPHPQSRL